MPTRICLGEAVWSRNPLYSARKSNPDRISYSSRRLRQ